MKTKKIIRLWILVFSAGILWSCSGEDSPTHNLSVDKEYKLSNVRYGQYDRNVMDVYLPANRNENTPFVIIIHGGGWVDGDKSIYTGMQQDLLKSHIASASINYRYVSSTVHATELMDDVSNVLITCMDNADTWKSRKNKFVLFGHSAGAHMAMLYAYRYDPQNRVAAVVEASGPTDFYDEGLLTVAGWVSFLPTIENLAQAKFVSGQPLSDKFKDISPLWNVKNVPTLMLQGTGDIIVWNSHAQKLDAKMAELGYTKEYYFIDGADHIFSNISAEKRAEMDAKVISWINRYGK